MILALILLLDEATSITDATTVPIAWMIGFGLAAATWGLWLQKKLSRIDAKLDRLEGRQDDHGQRYVAREALLQLLLEASRQGIQLPDLPPNPPVKSDASG